ncbi:agmatinase [Bosea caraganae]|uniref:Agmatinase n=1 Tax=Bosea caraganae TaxID=2763117 RepID=A0A370L5M4_9HYPH|nr:agmatinase [Bosea caraganae]RDJ23316.1 agmatinase [Bosea caraganae]RDJ24572.1 agmatinase [Bosea caraganae]
MTEPADTPTIDHAFTGDRRGPAHDPTYAGALSFMRRRYSKDVSGCDLVIWGVPFDLAVSNRPGTRFGPQALRRVSAIFDGDAQYPSRIDPFEHLSAVDYGDCLLPRSDLQGCAKAIEHQAAAIIATGAHLVTLGGDHFITLPLLRAHVARHGKLAVVQFDAHQDTWDDGVGAISHGTFMLEAVREDLIDVERSIQVGIRTVAPRDCGIEVLNAYEAHELGVAGVIERIKLRVGSVPAYLTFDIDALDPAFAPGTGTPVAGGFTAAEALRMVWAIRDLDFRGMDIVEVSPPYDHADATAIAGAAVAQHYIQALALKKAG